MNHIHLAADIGKAPGIEGWLVPNLIPKKGLVILAAPPKAGKTLFASHIARQLATGQPLLGHQQERIGVLWAAHEETREERKPYLQGLTPEDPLHIGFAPFLRLIDDPECEFERDRKGRFNHDAEPYLYQVAQDCRASLLVIDCLHASCRHTNFADNHAARRILGRLRLWSHNYNVATLVLHHVTKAATRGYHPERFADSAQILAAASAHFFMESVTLPDGVRKITLHGSGRNPAPPSRIDIVSESPFHFELATTEPHPQKLSLPDRIVELLEEGWELTTEEIARKLAAKPQSVRNALASLSSDAIERQTGPRNAIRYRLSETVTPN